MKINIKLLKKQIKAVLESNMPEVHKTGVHNLLGEILDNEEHQIIEGIDIVDIKSLSSKYDNGNIRIFANDKYYRKRFNNG